jgi:transmembrane sensor
MKPKTPRSRVGRLILEEASEWFVDFRVGDVDAPAREAFDEWLRRSPEHIRAYMEIAKTYVELPALQSAGSVDVDALIAYAHSGKNVVPFDNADASSMNEPPAPLVPPNYGDMRVKRAGRSRRTRYRFLAAASCALVFVIVCALGWRSERYPTYNTDIGERRSITLADGSSFWTARPSSKSRRTKIGPSPCAAAMQRYAQSEPSSMSIERRTVLR